MTKLSEMTIAELTQEITKTIPYLVPVKNNTLYVECYNENDLEAVKLLKKKRLTKKEAARLEVLRKDRMKRFLIRI